MRVSTAIIPVAGQGSRLYPAGKVLPKALLPIVDRDGFIKPLIHRLVAEALSAGVELVVVVAQPEHKTLISRYFTDPVPLSVQGRDEIALLLSEVESMRPHLLFVSQDSPEGFGHAVLCASDYVRREPVLIMVGDHVFSTAPEQPSCATQVVRFYEKYQRSIIGVEIVDASWVDAVALVKGDPLDPAGTAYRVDILQEKPGLEVARRVFQMPMLPKDRWLGSFGMDVLTPPIFDILEYNVRNDLRTRGEIQLRDAMETLVLLEGMVAGIIEGERWDVGNPASWAETMVRLALESPYRERVRRLFFHSG